MPYAACLCRYFVLIPRTMDVPCGARQVFTTVHDNQEQVGTGQGRYGDRRSWKGFGGGKVDSVGATTTWA